MYVYCVYPAMSKKSEYLSDLDKKNRNKRHSSPFINIVKGVFFVVRVTLVPVSYLSAPSAVHSYRVPGKFIRIVRIKQKFIRIAYLYNKCTDCRIKWNILKKNSKILQILQLAIYLLICNMYERKYFVILLYNLHIAFYIISLLKFRSLFKLV
jgi:hypothetical protein